MEDSSSQSLNSNVEKRIQNNPAEPDVPSVKEPTTGRDRIYRVRGSQVIQVDKPTSRKNQRNQTHHPVIGLGVGILSSGIVCSLPDRNFVLGTKGGKREHECREMGFIAER